jgi:endonuclease-3 related protein
MSQLQEAFEQLYEAYGPQHWWPGDNNFEMMVGAVLTQNTSWKNVERAIENLRESGALSVPAIHELSVEELSELIRPAGYFRLKAKRLKNLVTFVVDKCDGCLEEMFQGSLEDLRQQLLSINGIGPETADSILLYAGQRPTFVVDAYTARLVKRHGWLDFEADYYEIKSLFEDQLESDTQLFNEFHALIVRVGKEHCKKTPVCQSCPLESLLPEHGPCEELA